MFFFLFDGLNVAKLNSEANRFLNIYLSFIHIFIY